MKVLHVINELGGGGAEKFLSELATTQQDQGIEVFILLIGKNANDVYARELKSRGVGVISLGFSKYNIRVILKLRQWFLKIIPDVIHSHLFPSQYYVAFANIGINYPLVTTEHSTTNGRYTKKYLRFIEYFIYSRYQRIITISAGVDRVYRQYLSRFIHKIICIENGIVLSKYIGIKASKNYIGIAESNIVITMISRFERQKDHATVLKALQHLPSHIVLVLVGSGSLLDQFKKLAKSLSIETRTHFLGFRTDIPQLLSLSDIIVMSSHSEGFGLAAVEAMASSKPVIASDVAGLRDVVGDSGILFKSGNDRDLAQKITDLISNPEFYADVCKKCAKRAIYFDIKTTHEKYMKLYDSVLIKTIK